MTPVLLNACQRCGGAMFEDEDTWRCLLCGRALAPPPEPLPHVNDGSMVTNRRQPQMHEFEARRERQPRKDTK